jgi:hypothetical protein
MAHACRWSCAACRRALGSGHWSGAVAMAQQGDVTFQRAMGQGSTAAGADESCCSSAGSRCSGAMPESAWQGRIWGNPLSRRSCPV